MLELLSSRLQKLFDCVCQSMTFSNSIHLLEPEKAMHSFVQLSHKLKSEYIIEFVKLKQQSHER